MKYLYAFVVFFLCSWQSLFGQHIVSGRIFDTLNLSPLPGSAVLMLRASDSVMENFTRTQQDGTFRMNIHNDGLYILLVTFPGFADYTDVVNIKPGDANIQLDTIGMISRSHLLKEFVITQQIAAIKINGDTTEYMADSFKVKDNATVEDLLKKLPGLEVDKNGKVRAQGEEVKKILVDGEEFFSDDPAVVTKNLQSSVVEKVQIYDKKSDQAQFTGIDDGVKEKTINLQLKEDKKKGYFGKIDAGGGTDGYYQDMGMINDFKGKQQISVFGIASNTDQVGLGWADNEKYSSTNMVTEITDAGDVINYFSADNNDFASWDGTYNGQGLPQVLTGGVHYADRWDADQEHTAANYRYAMQDVSINSNTTTQDLLPGNVENITNQNSVQSSHGERHAADFTYDWKIDSSSTIKFTVNAGYKYTSTSSLYNTVIDNDDPLASIDSVLNTTVRRVTSSSISQNLNSDLLYQKKFKKKGRTLSLDVKENYKTAQSNGYLYSNSVFAGGGDSLTDQRKQNNSNTAAFAAKVVYTEPLSKVIFLQLNYSASVNNSTITKYSYDKPTGSDSYNLLDTLYSSNYKFNVLTNTEGVALRFVYDKVNFSFGSDVSTSQYKQQDLLNRDTTYNYTYLNLFPKASFTYKISKMTSLTLGYQGSTQQPTIDQIAPLHQNTDPLNIEIGNPALKQQFENTVRVNFNNYRVVSGSYFYIGSSATFINNAISTAQNIDPNTGIRTYQYINVDGNYTGYTYFGYTFKIPKTTISMGPDGNVSVNHTIGYINGIKNTSDDNEYTLAYSINYDKEKKFAFYEHPSYTYSYNTSSVSSYNSSYGQFYNNFTVAYYLPHHFEAGTSFEWWLRQRTAVFTDNNSIFKWNAYISKKYLKNDQLEVRATIFDILNQNTGLVRSAQNNIITQTENNTIRRHGMLSVIWNFTKAPKAAAADNK